MQGSRPDHIDSADDPNAIVSNVPSQPPYLKGAPDEADTADRVESAPGPENAFLSETPLDHPPSIFDNNRPPHTAGSQLEPNSPT